MRRLIVGGLLRPAFTLAAFVFFVPQAPAQTPIPVPPGFGHYCSMSYSDGTWGFALGQSKFSDPCLGLTKPDSVITRAGLWDAGVSEAGAGVSVGSGENSILIRCDKTSIPKKPSLVVDRRFSIARVERRRYNRRGMPMSTRFS